MGWIRRDRSEQQTRQQLWDYVREREVPVVMELLDQLRFENAPRKPAAFRGQVYGSLNFLPEEYETFYLPDIADVPERRTVNTSDWKQGRASGYEYPVLHGADRVPEKVSVFPHVFVVETEDEDAAVEMIQDEEYAAAIDPVYKYVHVEDEAVVGAMDHFACAWANGYDTGRDEPKGATKTTGTYSAKENIDLEVAKFL